MQPLKIVRGKQSIVHQCCQLEADWVCQDPWKQTRPREFILGFVVVVLANVLSNKPFAEHKL